MQYPIQLSRELYDVDEVLETFERVRYFKNVEKKRERVSTRTNLYGFSCLLACLLVWRTINASVEAGAREQSNEASDVLDECD